uniref:Integrase n=1 Tax=Strongyloides venezuelensis TaxID=75913 RepID=A0A0K0G5U6_STRVS
MSSKYLHIYKQNNFGRYYIAIDRPCDVILEEDRKRLNTITVLIRLTMRLLSMEQSTYLNVMKHGEMRTSIPFYKRDNQI